LQRLSETGATGDWHYCDQGVTGSTSYWVYEINLNWVAGNSHDQERKIRKQNAGSTRRVESGDCRARKKAEQAEVNLELEYYTLIDELQLKLEATEQKFELLLQANEDKWEEFKSELEHSWDSLRELIKVITAP
jgi:hypothetical protein